MGVFAGTDLVGDLGELTVPGDVQTVQSKLCICFATHDAQRFAARICKDNPPILGGRRDRAAHEISKSVVGE
jgi:hypothetical protein